MKEEVKMIIIIICIVSLIISPFIYGLSHVFCMLSAEEKSIIIDITEEDITMENGKFFIRGPNEKLIQIELNSGSVLDLSNHSVVHVRFTRTLPYFLHGGSDWEIDEVVKTSSNHFNKQEK